MNTPPPLSGPPQLRGPSSPPMPKREDDQRRMIIIIVCAAVFFLILLIFILSLLGGSLSGNGDGKPSEGSDQMAATSSEGVSEDSTTSESEAGSETSADETSQEEDELLGEDTESNVASIEFYKEEKKEYAAPMVSSQVGGLSPVGRENVGFFGIRATGNHIAYVIDKSSSMRGNRFELAQRELISSLESLDSSQSFSIFFYNTETTFRAEYIDAKATKSDVGSAKRWVMQVSPNGGTDPEDAIRRAFEADCDLMFILSDGAFSTTGDEVAQMNSNNIPVHAVSLETDSRSLEEIARRNSGQYRRVQ